MGRSGSGKGASEWGRMAMKKPILSLKGSCPFCMKIMVFMGEAQCLDKVEIAMDTPERRKYLEEKAGKAPTFPNLEDPETGKIMFESNDIIDKFAAASNVDPSTLTAFPYYMENFFPAYLNM